MAGESPAPGRVRQSPGAVPGPAALTLIPGAPAAARGAPGAALSAILLLPTPRQNVLTLPFGKRDRETDRLPLSDLGKRWWGCAPSGLSSVAGGGVLGGIPALSGMEEKRASEPSGLSNPTHNSWPPGQLRIGQEVSPGSQDGKRVDTVSSNHETAGLPDVSAGVRLKAASVRCGEMDALNKGQVVRAQGHFSCALNAAFTLLLRPCPCSARIPSHSLPKLPGIQQV